MQRLRGILKKLYRNKIALTLSLCLLITIFGICYWIEFSKNRTAVAVDGETWEALELGKLTPPLDKNGASLNEDNYAFGRTTFFDYFSDSQVTGASGTSYGSITDGGSKNTNTFKQFNKVLRDSLNNSISNTEYYKLTYPLYMGLFYYSQTDDQRGFGISTSDSPSSLQSVYNFWLNANSENKLSGTSAAATQGLINDTLDEDGNVTIGSGNMERVLPYFDSDFLTKTTHSGKSLALGRVKSDVAFPFRKESDGYYYFDSTSDVVQFKGGGNVLSYHSGSPQVYDVNNSQGFFPMNHPSDGDTGGTGKMAALNFGFGMKTELTFNMTATGKIKDKDITFKFKGDDDLWVFVDDYLIMDIGGAHGQVEGTINFATKKTTVAYAKSNPFGTGRRYSDGSSSNSNVVFDFSSTATTERGKALYEVLSDTSRTHTLTIFYMERGTLESNLYVKFNLPHVNSLSVGNEIDYSNVNSAFTSEGADLWNACNQDFFAYYLKSDGLSNDNGVSGTPITSPVPRVSNLLPIGLGNLRTSTENKDNGIYQLKFRTYTGKNYIADVVRNARITLPGKDSFTPTLEQSVTNGEGTSIPYVFMGWTTDSSYDWENVKNNKDTLGVPELEKTDSFAVSKSAEYRAVWAKKNITITYKDTFSTDSLSYEDTEQTIGTTSITQNADVKAELSFDSFQATGSFWNRKNALEAIGYQFLGWSSKKPTNDTIEFFDNTSFSPTCDMEFYAVWKKVKSAVTYKATSDATGSQQPWQHVQYITIGTGITLPADTNFTDNIPTNHNYTIVGWSASAERFDGVINTADGDRIVGTAWEAPYTDTTYFAIWRKVKSDITFHADKGSYQWTLTRNYYIRNAINAIPQDSFGDIALDNSTRKHNATTDINPTIKNYSIVGWTTDSSPSETSKLISYPYSVPDEDTDLYAVWSKTGSTVTYHSGTPDEDDDIWTGQIDYRNGNNIQVPTIDDWNLSDPTSAEKTENGKEYVITGWTYADGSKVNAKDTVTEDTDVFAVWKQKWKDITFKITVDSDMTEDWDASKCTDSRWKQTSNGDGSTTYSITLPCLAGKTLDKSIGTDGVGGSGYDTAYTDQIVSILFAPYLRECSEITGWYYGSSLLNISSFKIPYVEDDSNAITLNAKWVRHLNKVYFYSDNQSAGAAESGTWKEALTFAVSTDKTFISQLNPTIEDVFSSIAPSGDNYTFKGWSTKKDDTTGENLISVDMEWTITHGAKLYAVWDPPQEEDPPQEGNSSQEESAARKDILTCAKLTQKSIFIQNPVYLSSLGTLSSVSLEYLFSDPHIDLSVVSEAGGVAKTSGTSGGRFYLRFDEIATFLNAFTNGSNLRLRQSGTLYKYDTATSQYTANTDRTYSKLYKTVWEMRDLHGYITDRTSGEHKGKNLSAMPGTITTVDSAAGIYVYDGRVTSGGSNLENSFEFSNENTAAGASYVTDVRAIFVNQIQTGSISIKKELDETALAVAKRKKDTNRTYTFKMHYWNVFGSGNESKTLYIGEYTKIGTDGSKTIMNTSADGSILLKVGETAEINGIPVLTKYQVTENALPLSNRIYYLKDVQCYLNDETENRTTVSHTPAATPGEVTADYVATFTGQIEEPDYTYNYIVTNQIQVDGYDLYIEKTIDKYYYEEEFYPGTSYADITSATQSFLFQITYQEVDHSGNTIDTPYELKSIISFANNDAKTKQNKIVSLGPGYYEVSEEDSWSWKYQLKEIELQSGAETTPIYNEENTSLNTNKICRFYIPGAGETVSDTKTYNGEEYHVVTYDPVVAFTNHRKDNTEEGDTDIAINNVAPAGNTVTPATPAPVSVNLAPTMVNANDIVIYHGTTCSSSNADITKDFEPAKLIDDSLKTVTTDSNIHNPISIKIPLTSGRTVTKVIVNSKSKLSKVNLQYTSSGLHTTITDYEEDAMEVNGSTIYTYTFEMPSPVYNVTELQLLNLTYNTALAGYHSLAEIEILGYEGGDSVEPTPVPTATPTVTTSPVPNKTTTIYYKGYSNPYIHYKAGSGSWTTSPGIAMTATSELSGYTHKITIDLGTADTLTACFNNGSGTWDNNNTNNYTFNAGVYTYQSGTITKISE